MKRKTILLLLILLMIAATFNIESVFAASASFSVSGGGSYNKGNTVNITYTYSGATFGKATTTLSYDPSVLKYKGCSGGTGPQSASGVVSVITGDGSQRKSLTVTVQFEAIKVGTTNISFSHDVVNYDFQPLSVSSKTVSVSVKNPSPSVSSNANLSRLSVSAGSLSPAFSPSRTSYTVNVSNDVKICTLSAATEDDGATYTVSGSKNLSVGKNVRTVTVTAENGATRTYTITIIRAAAESGNTSEDPGETDDPQDNEQEETRPEDIKVTVNDKDYIVNEDIDENDFPAGFTMTIIQYNDIDIPAIVDMDLNYTLVMLTDPDTGDASWFFYDEESGEFSGDMKLSAEDVMEYASLKALSDDDLQTNQSRDSGNRTLLIILAGTVVLLAAFIIALQVMILKDRRKRGVKYETEDIKDQEKDI